MVNIPRQPRMVYRNPIQWALPLVQRESWLYIGLTYMMDQIKMYPNTSTHIHHALSNGNVDSKYSTRKGMEMCMYLSKIPKLSVTVISVCDYVR